MLERIVVMGIKHLNKDKTFVYMSNISPRITKYKIMHIITNHKPFIGVLDSDAKGSIGI